MEEFTYVVEMEFQIDLKPVNSKLDWNDILAAIFEAK